MTMTTLTQPKPLSAQPASAAALIGFGAVRHTRLKPTRHAFAYDTYFLMLPMRALQRNGPGVLARNRWAALSFYDADHGDARSPAQGGALGWLDELLQSEGIDDATGEVWLHCYPRVLGFAFKPVSFWYCHAAGGALRAGPPPMAPLRGDSDRSMRRAAPAHAGRLPRTLRTPAGGLPAPAPRSGRPSSGPSGLSLV